MFTFYSILSVALVYLSVLFAIAYFGDKSTQQARLKPLLYSLGLGIYCTSWAFYGVTGQATETGWWITPTYTGAILVYVFTWPAVLKVAQICQQSRITSLADFIARRYGQSSSLAGLITLVCVIAIIPYMALQIRALEISVNSVSSHSSSTTQIDGALIFTVVLCVFAILFGTRRVRSSEHNPGLMWAIAFESLIKLGAMLALGIFVCFFMFEPSVSLWSLPERSFQGAQPTYVYIVQTFVGALMMFCLPRQFHMSFIENNNKSELTMSRWIFPAYMVGMGIFALPLANAGTLLFSSQQLSPDSYLLQLPIFADNAVMTLLTFIGGFSAASSMVIVASIVLSIMVSNEVVAPWILKREFYRSSDTQSLNPKRLISVRRMVIIAVLMLAYGYHVITRDYGLLANTGLMSMALVAQFAPAITLGLFWPKANHKGAYRGIIVGSLVWVYTLFMPTLFQAIGVYSDVMINGPLGIGMLSPVALFGLKLEFISHGVLLSLSANLAVFVYYALAERTKFSEQLYASRFLNAGVADSESSLSVQDITDIMSRFMAPREVQTIIDSVVNANDSEAETPASSELLNRATGELSAIIGGPSTKLLLDSAKQNRARLLSDVVDLVDEASQVFQFNRSLLQSTLQNIDQGIAVIDKSLRLVAWNRRYIKMFDYPESEIFIGRPIDEIIRFNGERGLLVDEDVEGAVAKRMKLLTQGKPYKYRRLQSNGRVIEINGNPLPGGGFVTAYSDITEFVETQKSLEEINRLLEHRVEERTLALTELNKNLSRAKGEAEQANKDKTRYFAAVSHDLLQPLNAAMLFSSVLMEKGQDAEVSELSQNIRQSLESAEQLLTSVLELTKLDAGAVTLSVEDFRLSQVTSPIIDEYAFILQEKGLTFSHDIDDVSVRSDPKLLRRIIQNLMSNAAKYTESGEISLKTILRDDKKIELSVEDTGYGIGEEDQERIFDDFVRLHEISVQSGLGLGLAISSRMCRILGHKLSLKSVLEQGSRFSIELDVIDSLPAQNIGTTTHLASVNKRDLNGVSVLLVDNEPQVLAAMRLRLDEWGCKVAVASDPQSAYSVLAEESFDLLILDFHLDHNLTGLDLIEQCPANIELPTVIFNSADHSMEVRERIQAQGHAFLTKPTKPAALKRLIKRLVRRD